MASESGMGSGDIVSLAYPYALDAVDDIERAAIERRRASADPNTREDFDAAVRDVRETMAAAANAATTPPPSGLNIRILDAIQSVKQDESPTA